MKPLSIGEVAKRTGIRASALRYYEESGILPAAARVSGHRRYDADIIHRIDVLRFAQQAGFTLDEIKTLFHGFDAETPLSARWRTLARKKLQELEVLADRIRRMRRALDLGLKCGCIRIEDCTLSPTDVQGRRASARRQDVTADADCQNVWTLCSDGGGGNPWMLSALSLAEKAGIGLAAGSSARKSRDKG